MNRRDLFKYVAAAGSALLLPELIPKPVTYFLAPRGGWGAQRLIIRRVSQYVINTDEFPIRYDGTWDLPNGEGRQFHIDFEPVRQERDLARYDQVARQMLEDRMIADGGIANSAQFKLALPRGVIDGAYI